MLEHFINYSWHVFQRYTDIAIIWWLLSHRIQFVDNVVGFLTETIWAALTVIDHIYYKQKALELEINNWLIAA